MANKYMASNKGTLIYVLLFSILQSLLLLPSLFLIKLVFDQDLPEKNTSNIITHAVLIVVLSIIQSYSAFINRGFLLRVVKETVLKLQREILNGIILIDRSFFKTITGTALANRVVHDMEQVDILLSEMLSTIIPQLVLITFASTLLLLFNPLIGIAAILTGFTGVLVRGYYKKQVLASIKKNENEKDHLAAYVDFLPDKHLLIKVKNAEQTESDEIKRRTQTAIDQSTETARQGWKIKITDELTVNLGITLLIVLGALQVMAGYTTYGDIFGLYFLIVFIRRTVTLLQNSWINYQSGMVSLERILSMADQFPSVHAETGKAKINFKGSIELRNIDFRYEDDKDWILKDLHLSIRAGEVINVTGVNGIGKSSLLQLILGLYAPSAGSRLADGVNYENIDQGWLRSQIGYAPQAPIMMSGTIEDNLVYGLDAQLRQSLLTTVKNSPFFNLLISGFTNGLQTEVMAYGKNLSGGQIQRISLLRAMLFHPKLLILDEPTNHLDSQIIDELIKHLSANHEIAILIISHHQAFRNISHRTYTFEDKTLRTTSVYESKFKNSK